MNGVINIVGVASFPISPNPAVGTFYVGIDAGDGHLKIQDSSGAVDDYLSGAVYDDADAQDAVFSALPTTGEIIKGGTANAITLSNNFHTLAEVEIANPDNLYLTRDASLLAYRRINHAKQNQRFPDRFFTLDGDFLGSITGDLTSYTAGSGASTQNGTYGQDNVERAFGVTQMDTGTTSTGRAGLGVNSSTSFFIGGARYRGAARLALEALSNGTETFTQTFGFYDGYLTGGDGTNGIFFRYTDAQNGGRYECVTRAGGVDLQAVDSGVLADLDYHVFEIRINAAGDTAQFYIDGALVATITGLSNFPTSVQRFGYGFKIQKSVGTGIRNMDVDWFAFEMERSAAR